eukprot:4674742-Pyramimonas_sp.AAC.1
MRVVSQLHCGPGQEQHRVTRRAPPVWARCLPGTLPPRLPQLAPWSASCEQIVPRASRRIASPSLCQGRPLLNWPASSTS